MRWLWYSTFSKTCAIPFHSPAEHLWHCQSTDEQPTLALSLLQSLSWRTPQRKDSLSTPPSSRRWTDFRGVLLFLLGLRLCLLQIRPHQKQISNLALTPFFTLLPSVIDMRPMNWFWFGVEWVSGYAPSKTRYDSRVLDRFHMFADGHVTFAHRGPCAAILPGPHFWNN